MEMPVVSVICLCYNHKRFVEEAIQSVLDQTYSNVELIVVDDSSTDGSQAVIESLMANNPAVKFIPLSSNQGNCRAFNLGWKYASGKYIIDLSADDNSLVSSLPIICWKSISIWARLIGLAHLGSIRYAPLIRAVITGTLSSRTNLAIDGSILPVTPFHVRVPSGKIAKAPSA